MMFSFFKRAFSDMKASAKAQHELDRANLAATRAESRAAWQEAKQSPAARAAMMQEERDAAIASAKEREAAACARIASAKARNQTAASEE